MSPRSLSLICWLLAGLGALPGCASLMGGTSPISSGTPTEAVIQKGISEAKERPTGMGIPRKRPATYPTEIITEIISAPENLAIASHSPDPLLAKDALVLPAPMLLNRGQARALKDPANAPQMPGSIPSTLPEAIPARGTPKPPTPLVSPVEHQEEAPKAARRPAPRPVATEAGPVVNSPYREPLVLALEQFLRDRPGEALVHLQAYDRSSQELLLRMLPVLAQLTRKSVGQLDRQEAAALHEQMHGLIQTLRAQAELIVEQMCYCSEIESFGVYKPLPVDHVFRPPGDGYPGEPVQIYVQLRNLCPRSCAEGYQVCLASSVEICDMQDKRQWKFDFPERECSLRSQTPLSNCYRNYSFSVPSGLRPGNYRLTVTVRDLTRPESERAVRKTLPFRVGS